MKPGKPRARYGQKSIVLSALESLRNHLGLYEKMGANGAKRALRHTDDAVVEKRRRVLHVVSKRYRHWKRNPGERLELGRAALYVCSAFDVLGVRVSNEIDGKSSAKMLIMSVQRCSHPSALECAKVLRSLSSSLD